VLWVEMAFTGARNPLDAVPDQQQGNVYVLNSGKGKGKGLVLSGPLLEAARAHGVDVHTSHFATCPDSDRWRRT
jgi:hypothetical protein